ncbi:peptide/nickel transport system substrate-binding protein [Brevibacterium iodinum ATCC 49514]|uniref:Peptide/nickel transport system substrate-binding protein n=2 Tax=Brevibacterium iodinum TaxID=31943 RepID=A0A2H1ICD3_9MICO|nr:peptide/nickel transport system substrate-binding protein [Brevibacterium iodinum ATCC 49514]SUW13131.1 Probable monoacyl phosphatidylinositol tetramannoside-binding protein LpqW precursor [Brevibacterium iodinum]
MRKKATMVVAATAALGLALSGCQQANKDSGGVDSDKADKEISGLPTTDYQKAGYDEVKDGGTLTYPITEIPASLNYYHADGAHVDNNNIYGTTLGGPVKIKDDGTWEVDKNYAESVEIASEDPLVIDVKLNKDAVWEDGTPIDVDDYKAFWQTRDGNHDEFEVASTKGYEDIEKIESGKDKHDVKVTFKTPNIDWPNYIGAFLPNEITEDADSFNKDYTKKVLPSNGPYKADKVDTKSGVITMVKNDKWWGQEPKLDKVIFKVVSQAQQAQEYANKEIDLVDVGTDGDSYKTAGKREDGEMYKSQGMEYTHLTMNAKKGALKEQEVRDAIGHAINREAIAQAAIGPVEAPVTLINNVTFMPGQEGYRDNTAGSLDFDQEKAKKILDDAGWKEGDGGVREKDGEKLKFKIVVPADTASNAQRAEQLMKDLNEIGFKVEIETVPVAAYFADHVLNGNFEMATFTWQGTAFPISSGSNLFYPADSAQNHSKISSDAIGEKFKAATKSLDPAEAKKLANEGDAEVLKLKPLIPFYPTPYVWGVRNDVLNLGPRQLETPDWTEIGFKK